MRYRKVRGDTLRSIKNTLVPEKIYVKLNVNFDHFPNFAGVCIHFFNVLLQASYFKFIKRECRKNIILLFYGPHALIDFISK